MKNTKITISVAIALSLLISGCNNGDGEKLPVEPNSFPDISEQTGGVSGGESESQGSPIHAIPMDRVIGITDKNVTNTTFGAPDYKIIAAEVKTFKSKSLNETRENCIHTFSIIPNFTITEGNTRMSRSVTEWDKSYVSASGIRKEGLISTGSYPETLKDYPNYLIGGDYTYTDYDNESRSYTVKRDYKITSYDDLITFEYNIDNILVQMVRKGQSKVSETVTFRNQAALDDFDWNVWTKFTYDQDGNIDTEEISYGHDYNLTKKNVYDENGFYEYFDVLSLDNSSEDYSVGSVNNPEYVNHREKVHVGDVGDGLEYSRTKPMYKIISCDVSMDSYAVLSAEGDLLECNEDINRDGSIDKKTKYTWIDQWRLDTITTTENGHVTKEIFNYNELGNVSRIFKYLDGKYDSHRKFLYYDYQGRI